MGVGVGAARTYGEASAPSTSSSSSLSGAEDDDPLRDRLLGGGGGHTAHLRRLWAAARDGAPRLLREDAARDVAAWTRQGGALRALLVVSVSRDAILLVTPPSTPDSRSSRTVRWSLLLQVGSASLAALTSLLVVVFFLAATMTNAIICSLLVSLLAAGGFLAVLFAFVASIYVGALLAAAFVVATTTAATVIFLTIATGM
jgi:hypothetical protein